MKILVTGAEDYIGHALAYHLIDGGHTVVLFTTRPSAPLQIDVPEYISSIDDIQMLEKICSKYSIECIVHAKNFINNANNNTIAIQTILSIIKKLSIPKMVLISTADVYGLPKTEKVEEKQSLSPLSPYAETRAKVEQITELFAMNNPVTIATLRLFSVAGADMQKGIGPDLTSTNFMPSLMASFASRKKVFVFFGDDYATADGYAFRDFIHINDVAEAVLILINKFNTQELPYIEYNIGSGEGFSLKEIVNKASELLQMKIYTTVEGRREGDVARLVADISRIKLLLDWSPRYPLDQSILSTWYWCTKQS